MRDRSLWAVCADKDVAVAAVNCASRLALTSADEAVPVVGFVLRDGDEVYADQYAGPLQHIVGAVVQVPHEAYVMLELDTFTGACGNA